VKYTFLKSYHFIRFVTIALAILVFIAVPIVPLSIQLAGWLVFSIVAVGGIVSFLIIKCGRCGRFPMDLNKVWKDFDGLHCEHCGAKLND
jgi:hypothetical protein